MGRLQVCSLVGLFAATAASADPPPPKPQLPLSSALISDICSVAKICPRFQARLSDVKPSATYGSKLASNRFGALVQAFFSDKVIPSELLEGVFGFTQCASAKWTVEGCLRSAWLTESNIQSDDEAQSVALVGGGSDPYLENYIEAVGTRSIFAGSDVRDLPGPTFALVAATSQPSDLEDDYVLDRFIRQLSLPQGAKIERSKGAVSVSAENAEEFVAAYAYIYRDPLDSRRKFVKTERLALDKVAAAKIAPMVAKEARDAWRSYWLKKLQTSSLDEVARYMILESGKRLERRDFGGARASIASIHLFAADLAPATQKQVESALAKAEQALAEDTRTKNERAEVEKRKDEERKRAREAALQAQKQRELQDYIRQQAKQSCTTLKARLQQNRDYARTQGCLNDRDEPDAMQPKCLFYAEAEQKTNLVLDYKKCKR